MKYTRTMTPIFVMLSGTLYNVSRIISVKPFAVLNSSGSYLLVDGEPECTINETPEEVQSLIQDAIGRADDPFYDEFENDEWGL